MPLRRRPVEDNNSTAAQDHSQLNWWQEITSLAPPSLSQLVALQPVAERRAALSPISRVGYFDPDQPPSRWGAAARRAEFHQQFLPGERHRGELGEPLP